MDMFSAVILGIVQGVTEFLPISSTGHLILTRALFGIEDGNSLAFDAVLHLATVGAIILYFSKDIMLLVNASLRKMGKLPVNNKDINMVYALLIGTVPAVVIGIALESYVATTFRSPILVALVLFVGSFLFIYAEWKYQNSSHTGKIDSMTGLKIGLFQTLAMFPGMSRSGATISGGMLLGLTRSESARFSFLLAIPVILGAVVIKFLELIKSDVTIEWSFILVGAVTAFVTGLMAVHFMLSFIQKHTLWPFIWYRILLAGFIVFVFWVG